MSTVPFLYISSAVIKTSGSPETLFLESAVDASIRGDITPLFKGLKTTCVKGAIGEYSPSSNLYL